MAEAELSQAELQEAIDNPSAYFIPLGRIEVDGVTYERFMPTSFTYGAWGPFQHGAPPSALLTRMLERHTETAPGMRITRIAVDLLSAVPYTELRARSWVSRPGRQISKVEAELLADVRGTWRPVASASAWRMATADTTVVERAFDTQVPGPEESVAETIPLTDDWEGGYIRSIEARAGEVLEPAGTRIHWVRAPHPIVVGEEPTAVERLMQVADTANGIGATLSPKEWAFMNTDLVVHLHRLPELAAMPAGEGGSGEPGWLGIAARGSIGPDGIGMTAGELYDARGPVGRSMQTLLVRPQE
nr:thioesterase family protein [Corynebacterium lactis]